MKAIRWSSPRARSCSRSGIERSRRAATAIVALLAAAASLAPAQQGGAETAPAERSGLVVRTAVDLALVEVVVVDGRGRHVRGLPRDAFRIRLGDRLLPVESFDEIDLTPGAAPAEVPTRDAPRTGEVTTPAESAAPETPAAPVPASAEPAAAPAETERLAELRRQEISARLSGPRWFVLLFDGYNNVSPLRTSQARRAAKQWIDTRMRDGDMVAVFELNPYLSSVLGFTNDRYAIKKAIDETRIFPADSMGRDMVGQRLEQGGLLPRSVLEQQLVNAADFGGELLRAERDQFYGNMSSLAAVLSGLEGTRALLVFSGGFPLTRSKTSAAGGGFTVRFRDMLKSLEARGVRVFTFDIGVENWYTDASEATNFRIDLENLGFGHEWLDRLQVGAEISAANSHQEILYALANETGGRFWRNKDFKSGIEAADDDLSHYYLVGYRFEQLDEGEQRAQRRGYLPLKFEVDRPGLRTIARRGRFLPTMEELLRREAERRAESAWGSAPAEDEPLAGGGAPLDLDCEPQFHPGPDGRTLVVLPVRVSGDLAPVVVDPERAILDFDVRITAELAGLPIQHGSRNLRLTLPKAAADAVRGGFQFREAMLLPASIVDLEVQFRLNGLNRTGTWRSTVRVPERGQGRFGLTDLTLLEPAGPAPLIYDVFRKRDNVFGTEPPAPLPDPLGADASGRPPLYLGGAFSRAFPLLAQVRVTSPPPAPSAGGESPLVMDWELIPEAGGTPIAPPVTYRRLQMIEGGRMLDVLVDLDLKAVEPGRYALRLSAKEVATAATETRSRSIVIAP